FGVRGQGKVTLDPKLGPKLLPKLIERYVGPEDSCFRRWLLAQSTEEVAIIINPIRVMSWDYRKRMSI
ncbi:MAG: pyridoxamine 5'-phosphate oxidase family protein, partial [Pseudomonadota bacterium]|nr:pyridoxamine 5'-phosphate oxidase family protein [Pseudomonadota bacterium]